MLELQICPTTPDLLCGCQDLNSGLLSAWYYSFIKKPLHSFSVLYLIHSFVFVEFSSFLLHNTLNCCPVLHSIGSFFPPCDGAWTCDFVQGKYLLYVWANSSLVFLKAVYTCHFPFLSPLLMCTAHFSTFGSSPTISHSVLYTYIWSSWQSVVV